MLEVFVRKLKKKKNNSKEGMKHNKLERMKTLV